VPDVVGFIPARSGSKRIVDKNIKPLMGHPLLAYSVSAALDSGVFRQVVVSTDSAKYGDIAAYYGADVLMRPEQYATETSPDIEWVKHALGRIRCGAFAILRPTSPFRKAQTIQRAWQEFTTGFECDSLRAVEKCHEHPAKMWAISHGHLHPLMPLVTGTAGAPGHSSQYPSLPVVYVQNASLEFAWRRTVEEAGSIAGENIKAFLTVDDEGYDLNSEYDWYVAEQMVRDGTARLPPVRVAAWA
jgi:N-acylneuraminate cytidylyltransferase